MKKIILIIVVIIVSVVLFLFTYEFVSKQEQFFSSYSLSKQEISSLKEGDIVLRHGFGFVSDAIVKSLHEIYDISHCAIITNSDSGLIVIHSVSQSLSDFDGVQCQKLNHFIRDSHTNSVIVSRFKDTTLLKATAERAKYYFNKHVPFDNKFNIEDNSEIYCSELIWLIYKDVYNIDLFKDQYLRGDYDYARFETFWDTTKFDIILNHQIKKPN